MSDPWEIIKNMSENIRRNKKVSCADGFTMSVQAGPFNYSTPRNREGPYSQVEVGFPSSREELLMEWAEDRDDPTGTVYGWVPVSVVTNVIAKHGGVVDGEVPEGVARLEPVE